MKPGTVEERTDTAERPSSLWNLYSTFFFIGLFTFGGGMAMLPMLEREIIDKRRWCSREDLLDFYAVGQCTPGIIAVNTATFIGERKKGILGGAFATLGVISPSLVIITLLSGLLQALTGNIYVAKAFEGIRIVVCAQILYMVISMIRTARPDAFFVVLMVAAFAVKFIFNISSVFIVLGAVILGLAWFLFSRNRREGKEKPAGDGRDNGMGGKR